jgi:hypothetical protein
LVFFVLSSQQSSQTILALKFQYCVNWRFHGNNIPAAIREVTLRDIDFAFATQVREVTLWPEDTIEENDTEFVIA